MRWRIVLLIALGLVLTAFALVSFQGEWPFWALAGSGAGVLSVVAYREMREGDPPETLR